MNLFLNFIFKTFTENGFGRLEIEPSFLLP